MNLRHHLPAILLIAAALVLRLLTLSGGLPGWWPNVSPLLALAFVGAVLLPGMWRWAVLPALVAVDLFSGGLSMEYIGLGFLTYACLAGAILWGCSCQGKVSGLGVIGRLLGASVAFYLITNTASWMLSPAYAKTASGWVQALTVGLPGFPPTWSFFRNSLLSDVGFGVLLLAAHNLGLPAARQSLRLPWVGGSQASA